MYLTSNLLTGNIPEWVFQKKPKLAIDLSYNNFSENPSATNARSDTINMYRSFSERKLESGWLKNQCPACSKDLYSFNINCGGSNTTIGSTKFDADGDSGGPAKFFHATDRNWGTSSTGHFWDHINKTHDEYVVQNVSVLRTNSPELYTSARLSPLSLTYFGRCLANGKYTVTLHFAEIIFRDNQSFQSLGKRMFDVYIQDERVLKDFDIEYAAHGVDKEVNRTFNVLVRTNTLEIRFYWAGKGTTGVPTKLKHGPLISAISAISDNMPSSNGKKKIFIEAAALALCFIAVVLFIGWWKCYLGSKMPGEQDLRSLDLQTGLFTFRQIKAATNNFSAENKIGEGGFGSVFKGTLLDGTAIAVKQLSSKSKQGNREFVNEIGMVSALQHPNLVRLYGCCIERNQLLLVYEYMENNSLARALYGPEQWQLELDWPTRKRICIGIARGLAFLHEESTLKIVHRDIKTTNVLLDKDLNPKVSDFGLAKLDEEENTHISTRVAGTIGYMAPEYALWGYLTYKADVYSFGIVVLETVAGKNNMKYRHNENYVCLLDWALVLQQKGSLLEVVDPRLNSNFNKEEAIRIIKVALLCTNPSPALRPTMSAVVSMLEGRTNVVELDIDPSIHNDELKLKALRDTYDKLQLQNSSETETLISSEIHNESSSISGQDLYPINLYSQC